MANTQELQTLYRQTVLDHSRQPRNFRRVEHADRVVVGHNPLCGDKITLYLCLDHDQIDSLTFEGTGCAIAMASASIMTESLNHQSLDRARREIEKIKQQFALSASDDTSLDGDMAALDGVRAFPSRIKCATLAWKTLEGALQKTSKTVTTEE